MTISKAAEMSREKRGPLSLRASISEIPRRVNHGGAPWLRRRGEELRQPQDGATETADRNLAAIAPLSNRSGEGEDARITGGTRSLVRRLMGLNVASTAKLSFSPSGLGTVLPRRTLTA